MKPNTPIVRAGGFALFGLTSAAACQKSPNSTVNTQAAVSCIAEAAFGGETICVRLKNGSVQCFGAGNLTLGKTEISGPPMASITSGAEAVCGLDQSQGKVWCWNKETGYQAEEAPEMGSGNVQLVALHGATHCTIRANGDLFCHAYRPIHPQGTLLTQAVVAAHRCALTARGVECWGSNRYGIMGLPLEPGSDGDEPSDLPPRRINGLPEKLTHLVTTGAACVLSEAGEVWCWGGGYYGEIGAPGWEYCSRNDWERPKSGCTPKDQPVPQRVQLPEPMKDLVEAGWTMCALGVSGRVWCWGNNNDELVVNPMVKEHVYGPDHAAVEPLPILNPSWGNDNTHLFGGYGNVCSLKPDGSLWCAGRNAFGQVARGVMGNQPPTRMPVKCP